MRLPRCFSLGGWTRFHPSRGSGWFPSTRSSALRVPCGIFALVLAVQSSYTLGPTWCGTCCPNCPERRTLIRFSKSRENICHGHGERRSSGRLFSGVLPAVFVAV